MKGVTYGKNESELGGGSVEEEGTYFFFLIKV